MKPIRIADFEIGTWEDPQALTGVSVILARNGAVGGVSVRGNAPGTRETDLLQAEKTVEHLHAVVLSGGSAYGLDSCSGVMAYLEEQGIGFDVGVCKVPIVAGCVLFDLAVGNSQIRPDKQAGYQACQRAGQTVASGNIGAGCGATVGKLLGFDKCMKGGTGYHEIHLDNGLRVGAYVCVNACGEVYCQDQILAGIREPGSQKITPAHSLLLQESSQVGLLQNTTIGCILTNATLTKPQCNLVAQTAHNGYALAIRPVHTTRDGDTIFTLAAGQVLAAVDTVAYLAQTAMHQAILDAILSARGTHGIACSHDLHPDLV